MEKEISSFFVGEMGLVPGRVKDTWRKEQSNIPVFHRRDAIKQ